MGYRDGFVTEDLRALIDDRLGGQYAVQRELGRGGMGVVYLARELRLDRLVAIKVLPPALEDAEIRERFLREARTAAQLSHPNIVPIFRADEIGNLAFFSMGYVEGESFAERIQTRGRVPAGEVVRVLRDAAWALAYAHARGVIHRDVKPENLMIERGTGRVVVTDFGIARDTRATNITRDGWILGSVHYMSPEQAAGGQLDGRSDLYALGIIGWQALSGRLPFEAEQASAVVVQQATRQAPPLHAAAPDVPRQVAAVIDRCLAKNPADRFPTGEALAEALTAAWETAQQEPGADSAAAVAVSPERAQEIWRRAAELQAEAATRVQRRYRAPAPCRPGVGCSERQLSLEGRGGGRHRGRYRDRIRGAGDRRAGSRGARSFQPGPGLIGATACTPPCWAPGPGACRSPERSRRRLGRYWRRSAGSFRKIRFFFPSAKRWAATLSMAA